MLTYDRLSPETKLLIRRRMHYSDKRARRWFESMGSDHALLMISQWVCGFGTMRDLMQADRDFDKAQAAHKNSWVPKYNTIGE